MKSHCVSVFVIPASTDIIEPEVLEKLDLNGMIRVLFKTRNSKYWARGGNDVMKTINELKTTAVYSV